MNATSRPDTAGVPAPADDARDFVVVDDSGAFSYYPTAQDLLGDFEYVGEASCIIDRSGTSCDLALDRNRHLILGRDHGPVEFHWLRQAVADAWETHPEEHRLRRLPAPTLGALVSGLFETLQLVEGHSPEPGPWTVDIGGLTVRRSTLRDVDQRLATEDQLDGIRVKDPLGHIYRPVRHRRHWFLPNGTGFIVYEEVPAKAQ
ncbi:hypothetical protein E5206_13625 [Arthrobacter sp. PAMC25564]|uniref:hypothetical protein n=1 Tax=Arthrobacter sp. PAMC25564 TaxID=2565366 RepID=UPI0010A206A8|nr:hypothetical protein [Arthrobacter sp. PAMC25564]QCB97826.1 hypothetical protein E5206_13625 [Arthrobacter sp. PAMC25564]